MSTDIGLAVSLRRFRPYPKYKDSGVEWLGEIPAHWQTMRLKYLASVNDEVLREDTDPNLEISYVEINSVDSNEGITSKERLVFEQAPSRARRIVRQGDVIVSTVRTYLRAIATIEGPEPNLIVSTGFAVIRPRHLDSSFAGYALRAPNFVDQIVAKSVGVSYPAINASDLTTFPITYPDKDEQRAIAAFLDRETARIDALVAKMERLIELLQEKCTALITRAVTKGLDPKVRMKDSGVEWLGEIPAHWNTVKFRFASRTGTQNGLYKPQDCYDESGTPIISMAEAFASPELKVLAKDRVLLTTDEYHAYKLERGDLLFARRSLVFDGSGKCSLVGALPEPHVFESSIIRVRPDTDILEPRFALLYLSSPPSRFQVLRATKQVTISGIDAECVKEVLVLLPPLQEQCAIVAHLDKQTRKIDRLIAHVRGAVDRLKELRTALISAAVTGQIDVREEAA